MSDVDWLALWAEFAQATDNNQLEVAERIVYLDGRWDFTELSSSKLLAAARQIIRERVVGMARKAEICRDVSESALGRQLIAAEAIGFVPHDDAHNGSVH